MFILPENAAFVAHIKTLVAGTNGATLELYIPGVETCYKIFYRNTDKLAQLIEEILRKHKGAVTGLDETLVGIPVTLTRNKGHVRVRPNMNVNKLDMEGSIWTTSPPDSVGNYSYLQFPDDDEQEHLTDGDNPSDNPEESSGASIELCS